MKQTLGKCGMRRDGVSESGRHGGAVVTIAVYANVRDSRKEAIGIFWERASQYVCSMTETTR